MKSLIELWEENPDKRPLRVSTDNWHDYVDIYYKTNTGVFYGLDASNSNQYFLKDYSNKKQWSLYKESKQKLLAWLLIADDNRFDVYMFSEDVKPWEIDSVISFSPRLEKDWRRAEWLDEK